MRAICLAHYILLYLSITYEAPHYCMQFPTLIIPVITPPLILGLNILLSNLFRNIPICVLPVRLLHERRRDARIKVTLSCHFHRRTEKIHERPQAGELGLRPRFEFGMNIQLLYHSSRFSHEVSRFYSADIRF
jgi:hypothetical protein